MSTIAIVRRSPLDKSHIASSLYRTRHRIIDIRQPSGLSVNSIEHDHHLNIQLGGVSLQEIDILFFWGIPAVRSKPAPLSRDDIYINQETEQAFLAGVWNRLHAVPADQKIRVINSGFVFAWNRLLFSATQKLQWLARIGWATGTVTSYMSFGNQKRVNIRNPNPSDTNSYILTLTARRFILSPAPDHNSIPTRLLNTLISRTQQSMPSIGLDWCSIPIVIEDNSIWAFGFSTDIPTGVDMQDMDLLTADILEQEEITV